MIRSSKRNQSLKVTCKHIIARHQAQDPGTEHLPLQPDPGFPDRLLPGADGRHQHIRHTYPQHGGSSGALPVRG